MKKLIFFVLLILLVVSNLTGFANLQVFAADKTSEFSVPAKAAIAVDADGGKILYAQNATDAKMGIASITKLLTVYLVYQAVQERKIKWTDKVPISAYAYQMTQNIDASNVPFAQGEKFTVADLVDAALIPSANSAAIALAEYLAGSEPKFVDKMQGKLKSWGVTDAKIFNASGLNNSDLPADHRYPGSSENDENVMSAEDVAIIAIHLIKDYPQVLDITKQTSMVFDKGGQSQTTLNTTNDMLSGLLLYREGVDGLKTGSTLLAGDCFVGTTNEKGFRIITVLLNADNSSGENTRFTATTDLMDEIYGTWQAYRIEPSGTQLKECPSISVTDGKKAKVSLETKEDFNAILPIKEKPYTISIQQKRGGLKAPVKKGTTAAMAQVTVKDKLGYLPQFHGQTVALVTETTVKRANPFVVGWNNFVSFVNKNL